MSEHSKSHELYVKILGLLCETKPEEGYVRAAALSAAVATFCLGNAGNNKKDAQDFFKRFFAPTVDDAYDAVQAMHKDVTARLIAEAARAVKQ